MKLQIKYNSAVSFQSVLRTDEIAHGVDYKFIYASDIHDLHRFDDMRMAS